MNKKKLISSEKDEELRKRFKKTKLKDKIYKIIGILTLIISVFMFYKGNGFAGSILLLVGLIGCLLASLLNKSHFKNALSVDLIPGAFKSIFDNFDYRPKGCIDKDIISSTDMGFPFSTGTIDIVKGDDFVKGSYHGVEFEACNVDLQRRDTSDTAEYNDDSLFIGQWIVCDFKKRLSADVILSKNKKNVRIRNGNIETDNDEFNEYYSVYSDNAEEVLHLLTPHMMKFIVSMDKNAWGDTYFHFLKNGKVHVAIESNRDLFELDKIAHQDYDRLTEQIKEEVRYIAFLINKLKHSLFN